MMPKMLEPNEYELFDYKHFSEKELSLEEAIREVRERRAVGRSGVIYRIVPADSGMQGFRIQEVSVSKVTEEFRLRVSDRWARLLSRYRLLAVK
jgi:hypothetical protein